MLCQTRTPHLDYKWLVVQVVVVQVVAVLVQLLQRMVLLEDLVMQHQIVSIPQTVKQVEMVELVLL